MNKVSLFSDCVTKKSKTYFPSNTILKKIREKTKFHDKILRVRSIGDKTDKEYQHIKKYEIPAVTWAGVFFKRRDTDIKEFSQLMYIDGDKQDPDNAKTILEKVPYVRAVWESVGGNGFGALIGVEAIDATTYIPTYQNLIDIMYEQYGLKCDRVAHNLSRLNIFTHDKDIMIKEIDGQFPKIYPKLVKMYNPNYKQVVQPGVREQKGERMTQWEYERCLSAYNLTHYKIGTFSVGRRHAFSISYFGLCNRYGVRLESAYTFAKIMMVVSDMSYIKAMDMYDRYKDKFGLKKFKSCYQEPLRNKS